VTGVKHYFGPNSKEGGALGAISVVECKSPEKLVAIIRQIPPVAQTLLRKLAPDEEEFQATTVKLYEGVEAVGEVKADAIVVDNPVIIKMEEQERETMRTVWGDDKFRFLIAQADAKTLVVTFGGGTKMLSEAMKGAKGKVDLAQRPFIAPTLARLPKRRSAVGIFDLAQAMNAYIKVGVAATGQPIPWRFHSKLPLAGAVAIEKTELSFTGYVPVEPIQEIFKTVSAPPPEP